MTQSATQQMRPVDWFALAAYIVDAIVLTAADRPEQLERPLIVQDCYNQARAFDAERLRRLAQQPKDPS